ncbi:MAG TPA: decaprenyl-phosphate phosphoribosyltransferase [Streptosporangiaceae bacterium]|nr:decaprenyl-phosphate phosphoribosyltransferase [Streptosporangiaceae bacterium]
MTTQQPGAALGRWLGSLGSWLGAVVKTARPRQWPKNLLVLAAPIAGASLGRDDGAAYALVAVVAFTAASSAVYFVNDVLDAERDRQHPKKRYRPVASGALAPGQALAVAALLVVAALAAGAWIGEPLLSLTIAAYLVISFAYSLFLKHVPVVELAIVASGFVLRALGGAAATHVPPSGWFLTVVSLGAMVVAVNKRRGELATLGAEGAARHRPVMRWYRFGTLSALAQVLAMAMIASYALWAAGNGDGWAHIWHLVSVIPLALALVRFDWLSGRGDGRPVEDLIVKDRPMIVAEMAWLALFALGLSS